MNASLHRSASHRFGTSLWLALGLCVSAACFIEDPLALGGDDTNGPACVAGEIGCMCTGDGTCGDSLSCLPQENVCIPTGCAPASAFCTCDDGSCDGALACQSGICVPPDGQDDGVDDDTDDDAGSTSTGPDGTGSQTDDGSGTSIGTSDTGDTGGSGDTSGDSGSDDSEDTGPVVVCTDNLGCSECFTCASEPAQDCEPQNDACQSIGGCPVVAQCLQGCSAEGLCLDDCCSGVSGAAVTAAHALDSCRRDTCATTCGDFNDAPCSGS